MSEEIITKEYELAFLGLEESVAQKAAELVARLGGEIFLQGPVERIALEYKIKKAPGAYFGYFHLRMTPVQIEDLKRELNVFPPVLRFLIVTPPFQKMKPRSARPARPASAAPAAGAPVQPETADRRPETLPLSNEALEKKIEEILKQ